MALKTGCGRQETQTSRLAYGSYPVSVKSHRMTKIEP